MRREHPSLFSYKAVPAARQALSCASSPREAAEKAEAETRAAFGELRPLLRARLLNEVEANALDLVVSLPLFLREYAPVTKDILPDGSGATVWHIPRDDGKHLVIVAGRGQDGPDSRLVTMYVDDSENAVLSQRKSPDLGPSPYWMSGEEDTGQGISVFTPDSQNGASHMTDASMPGEPAAVKGWDTPEAAREASPVWPSPGGEGTPPVSESIPCDRRCTRQGPQGSCR